MVKSVLVVDDSAVIRRALRRFFDAQTEWTTVGEAEDGAEAIEKALQYRPDLILLDVRMPKLNGVETAFILKRKLPNSIIIVFTLYDESVGLRLSATVGVDLIVSKADGLSGLIEGIHQVMGSAGLN